MTKSTTDANLYYTINDGTIVLLLLYVDDILLTSNTTTAVHTLQAQLAAEFATTDLGDITCYLGVQFLCTSRRLLLHQHDFALSILRLTNMLATYPSPKALFRAASHSAHSSTLTHIDRWSANFST
jgi:hypothetical protein